MRTWSYWGKFRDFEDEQLDLKHYEAIGTMTEALSMHANEAYDELDDEQKRICEMLFKAITEKRGENFGIRRPTRLNEIAAISDVSEEDVMAVIEKFREPGRSLLTPAYGTALTSKSMIDISHESLMRIWVRLKNWVDDEAEAVQMYLRLAEAAAMYQVGKAGLWRPPDLQLALNWQVKHKPSLVWGQRYHPAFERTLIFLEYSKKEFDTEQRIKELEAKRKLQRARTVAIVLGGFLVVALIAVVYAFIQQTEAKRQEQLAVANEKIAQANEKKAKIAEADALVQKDKAKRQTKIAEAEKIRADEQRSKAEASAELAKKNAILANEQKKIAEQKEKDAKASEQRANQEKDRAEINEKESQRQRYLAIGKSMAIKSKELNNDPEQEALLAQQAFNFNDKYGGYAHDNDIYSGLYYALKAQKDPLTKSLAAHQKGAARALVTSQKGNHIFSGGSDGKIIQWNYSNGEWIAQEIVPDRTASQDWYQVYSLDISADGNMLIAGGLNFSNAKNNYAELYDLRNAGAAPKKIFGFVQSVENVVFTPDGKGFYARDNSGRSIKYSDLTTAKEVILTKEKIVAIDLSNDGKRLTGVGDEGNLYIWDITNNFSLSTYRMPGKQLTAVSFSPDASQIIVGNERGRVWITWINKGVLNTKELSGHVSSIEQIKYNNAGNFMVTASKDYKMRLWNMTKLNQPPTLLSEHDWVWNVTFSPDDEQLMAGIHSVKETVIGQVDQTIHTYPTKIKTMSGLLCGYLKRNMTKEEWDTYVAEDLIREKTCAALPLEP